MSLLLDALKKAERAKEEAERRAKGGEAPEPQPDPDATVADPGRHVMRKDELPDISAPLEILSEDIRPGAKAVPAPNRPVLELQDEPVPAPEPEPKPRPAPRRDAARVDSEQKSNASSERAAAQKVF